ncbi:UDP-N-acetylglucosamine 1-carboxyvinyltransferase [Candidatus Saccharibacteria bacterium]|nr:UDP-N-acetylglucosamine 1-carboxyvinyltransferase [Candidatus Saccharibacteria bacterium]NCU40812.1 UDP-N-acetylglucosamine 1-carboxyvinyltransferase [Candidatus Saccharibacteria bacterium]
MNYKEKLGQLIQQNRISRGMTQSELAEALGSSQSAINRIEKGGQNISLEMLARISEVLSSNIISFHPSGTNFEIKGGAKLSGEINVNTSKNAAVGLLCASLLNKGTTTLRHVPRIEEVNRIIEVLTSIGVKTKWLNNSSDLLITPPVHLKLESIDVEAAKRTRTIIMFLGPLLHQYESFTMPFAGGCSLGTRTVEPHMVGLKHFGMNVTAKTEVYEIISKPVSPTKDIVLIERGDTVTENVIMAAAMHPGTVTIRNASANYSVQDVCFFLEKLGVKIEGIGTTILRITGKKNIRENIEYDISEDPIEAMSFVAAAVVTNSEITIKRAPIEFLELELATLEEMGLNYTMTPEYRALNGRTRLVDITIQQSKLNAPKDKLHALPFPGINMDNLPFLGLIATVAKGRTLIHDWSYENRAIYFTELTKLNAQVELLDPHRVYIEGPTRWKPADIIAPAALRPTVVILLAMLATPGTSRLRNVYQIDRGYEQLAQRLNGLGADIRPFRDI